jgi:hypothetical protein
VKILYALAPTPEFFSDLRKRFKEEPSLEKERILTIYALLQEPEMIEISEVTNPINNYGKYGIESFESAAWYWHFVDVVWIFVFGFVYVWSHLTVLDLQ